MSDLCPCMDHRQGHAWRYYSRVVQRERLERASRRERVHDLAQLRTGGEREREEREKSLYRLEQARATTDQPAERSVEEAELSAVTLSERWPHNQPLPGIRLTVEEVKPLPQSPRRQLIQWSTVDTETISSVIRVREIGRRHRPNREPLRAVTFPVDPLRNLRESSHESTHSASSVCPCGEGCQLCVAARLRARVVD